MKKQLVIVSVSAVVIFVISLVGCSGISREEYQIVVDANSSLQAENTELQAQVDELLAAQETLITETNTANIDNYRLRKYLISTYDACRYMLLYVTTEVFNDTLSKAEWEEYITNPEHPIPNYDEISDLLD